METCTPEPEPGLTAECHEEAEADLRISDEAAELLEEANEKKSQGNDNFKRQRFGEAVKCYESALEVLDTANRRKYGDLLVKEEDFRKVKNMMAALWCNLSMCRLQQQLYDRAISAATECLKFDPNNAKALHRRSLAHEKVNDLENALADSTRLRNMGDVNLNETEKVNEEKRRIQLWEQLQAENRDIDQLATESEPYWRMRDRFNALLDKYDLGDGQFFLFVVKWLTIDEHFDKTVDRAAKHWKIPKDDTEYCVRWIKRGVEAKKNDPELKKIIASAWEDKRKMESEQQN